MATIVLIPGAGGAAWYWHRVVPWLEAAGHQALAVDLPADDEDAGLDVYADRVVGAIGGRASVVVVAQSMGGFTAPLVCARVPVMALVFVNAMIPVPGETAGAWGDNVGASEARTQAAKRHGYPTEFDDATYFFHDVSEEDVRESAKHERQEAKVAFTQPCRFDAWPAVPTHVLVGADDRLFPREFQERVARERLGKAAEVIRGGHLVALSNPRGLAERLLACAAEVT